MSVVLRAMRSTSSLLGSDGIGDMEGPSSLRAYRSAVALRMPSPTGRACAIRGIRDGPHDCPHDDVRDGNALLLRESRTGTPPPYRPDPALNRSHGIRINPP